MSHHVALCQTKSHRVSPCLTASLCLTVSHDVSLSLTMSHRVSPHLTASHRVSPCVSLRLTVCLTVSHSVSLMSPFSHHSHRVLLFLTVSHCKSMYRSTIVLSYYLTIGCKYLLCDSCRLPIPSTHIDLTLFLA